MNNMSTSMLIMELSSRVTLHLQEADPTVDSAFADIESVDPKGLEALQKSLFWCHTAIVNTCTKRVAEEGKNLFKESLELP